MQAASEAECKSWIHAIGKQNMNNTRKLEGYLIKQGGIRKNWKRRYFVLTSNLLEYYDSNRV